MRRLISDICLFVLLPIWLLLGVAQAQFNSFPPGVFTGRAALDPAPSGSYTGPGDITTFLHWYSTGRAYSAAYAAPGTNNAFQVCDVATGLTCFTATIQTNGKVNQAAVVASSACAVSCYYANIYDQVGSLTLPQQHAQLLFSANTLVSLPCLIFNTNPYFGDVAFTQAQPFSVSGFGKNVAAANSPLLAASGGGLSNYLKNGTAGLFAGTADETVTATDGAYHAVQWSVNGASTVINVDASDTTVAGTPGANGFAGNLKFGQDGFGTAANATYCEAGVASGAWNATVRGQLSTNQTGFW